MSQTRELSLVPTSLQKIALTSELPLWLLRSVAILLGVAFLSGLAQVAIPLPFSPVPITGQSFGVLLIALCYGRHLAPATVFAYLCAGWAGLPVFAQFKFGFAFPTFGYLIGMVLCAYVVAYMSERGWAKSFFKAFLVGTLGTSIIFACGLIGLSFFVPKEQLLIMGLLPFLPGGILKITLAAGLAKAINERR